MASDAWATGQGLYALAHAGIKPNEGAISRGQTFLVKTQLKDGSWPMTSRPTKPGGKGSMSLILITAQEHMGGPGTSAEYWSGRTLTLYLSAVTSSVFGVRCLTRRPRQVSLFIRRRRS